MREPKAVFVVMAYLARDVDAAVDEGDPMVHMAKHFSDDGITIRIPAIASSGSVVRIFKEIGSTDARCFREWIWETWRQQYVQRMHCTLHAQHTFS